MIKIPSPLTFFEAKSKICNNPIDLGKPLFGVSPEIFDLVDMATTLDGELVSPIMNSKVSAVSDIDLAVIATPIITVDDILYRKLT